MKPKAIFVLPLAFLLAACGSVRRGEPIIGPKRTSNPTLLQGEIVFQQRCYHCHPGGEGGLGPSLNDKPAPVWLMKTQVRSGLGSMPSFDENKISARELDDLMAYLIALRKADRPDQ